MAVIFENNGEIRYSPNGASRYVLRRNAETLIKNITMDAGKRYLASWAGKGKGIDAENEYLSKTTEMLEHTQQVWQLTLTDDERQGKVRI